jgi:ABC-2 type transport system permease protein
MSASRTMATAVRVLTQLRHDPRTIALLLGVPCLLMGLLRWQLDERPGQLDALGAPLLALFPFITMFLVTSVTMLRERIGGTLERLLTTPIAKLDLLLGYWLAFAVVAGLQVSLVSALSLGPLDVDVAGPIWVVVVVAVIDALLGVGLGLLVSAFARTEFQAIQFLPAIVFPQLLLCGLLVPRPELPDALRVVSDLFPLSYAMDAMITLAASSEMTPELRGDVVVTAGAALVALALAAGTLRRRSA